MLFPISINDSVLLRPLTGDDALALFQVLEQNRSHLDPWLRWSGRLQTIEDVQQYIGRFKSKLEQGDGFHLGLYIDNALVGGIVCHFINRESRKTEIGYWLTAGVVGKGLVTQSCLTVIGQLFSQEGMHRIEIQCATDNVRSRAVAERLGFTFEGIKQESEWLTSRFADHAMYALLEYDWPKTEAPRG